jgi:hypothetical protein
VDTEDDPGPAIGLTGARFGGAPRRKRSARQKAAKGAARAAEAPNQGTGGGGTDSTDSSTDGEAETGTVVFPAVGAPPGLPARSGARQHGAPPPEPAPPPVPEPPPAPVDAQPEADEPVVGLTGARFGSRPRRRRTAEPAAAPEPAPAASTSPPPAPPLPELEPVEGGSAFVRPYVFTRGRTRAALDLSIETLVSAVPGASTAGLGGEHHAVLALCGQSRSVAELAARVGVPLGVARVLVGDLATAGAVAVHHGTGEAGPDLELMQRVLSGLRRL